MYSGALTVSLLRLSAVNSLTALNTPKNTGFMSANYRTLTEFRPATYRTNQITLFSE